MIRETGTYRTTSTHGETVRAFLPHPLPPAGPPLLIEGHLAEGHAAAVATIGRLGVAGAMVAAIRLLDRLPANPMVTVPRASLLLGTTAPPGTLTLDAANTFSGATAITGGTLAIGSSGSIANTTGVALSSGANFDVSAASGFTIGAAQTLSGVGTVAGTIAIAGATIVTALTGIACGGYLVRRRRTRA